MDASFMSRVKERLALATTAGSWPSASTSESLPILRPLSDVLATYSLSAELRCVECKAPIMDGSLELCVACGRSLPGDSVGKRDQFALQKSLALRLFYEASKLDIPEKSLDINPQLEPPTSGTEAGTTGEDLQYAPSATDFGFKDFELSSEEVFGPWQETRVENAEISGTRQAQDLTEVEEEYIWASAETDNLGSVPWTEQFAANTDDFLSMDFMPANTSAFFSGVQSLGQNELIDFDFFQAPPHINNQTPKPQSNYSDLLNLGELSWSSPQADAFPSSTPMQQSSSTNDFFRQLEGLNLSNTQLPT